MITAEEIKRMLEEAVANFDKINFPDTFKKSAKLCFQKVETLPSQNVENDPPRLRLKTTLTTLTIIFDKKTFS